MNARTTALSALIAMRRQNAWADGALKDYTARDRLDRRDAALAARLLYGVVQNRMLLDFYLAQAVASPLTKLQPVVLDILRLGAYQILFLDKIPVSAAVNEAVEQTKTYANKRAAGLVNGSLRTLARRKDELEKPHDLATKYSHPQPLVDCLRASMDEETLEAFLAADNDIPKTALQVNPLKAAPEQVAAALDEAGVAYEPHPWLPGCFLVSGTGNLEALPLFQSGAVYVQDAAAKLAVLASGAAPGMRVLDCCAAPAARASPPPCRWKTRAASCPATCTRIRFP
ncbi:MAG: transcription antitermination factor NusB [Oscillospiraceae bacterium]